MAGATGPHQKDNVHTLCRLQDNTHYLIVVLMNCFIFSKATASANEKYGEVAFCGYFMTYFFSLPFWIRRILKNNKSLQNKEIGVFSFSNKSVHKLHLNFVGGGGAQFLLVSSVNARAFLLQITILSQKLCFQEKQDYASEGTGGPST